MLKTLKGFFVYVPKILPLATHAEASANMNLFTCYINDVFLPTGIRPVTFERYGFVLAGLSEHEKCNRTDAC